MLGPAGEVRVWLIKISQSKAHVSRAIPPGLASLHNPDVAGSRPNPSLTPDTLRYRPYSREQSMMDIGMLVLVAVLALLTWGLLRLCEKVR
jgi:hypothetical protein